MRYNSSVPFNLNLCINLYKKDPSKCKFSDFWLLAWKVTRFIRSFFLPRVSFPLKFESSFIVMTHKSYEMFYLKHYMILTERAHQCTIFQTVSALLKIHPILYVIFATTMSGFIQSLRHCLVSSKITPLYFLAQTLYNLDKNSPSNEVFGLLSDWVKTHKIPYVIFETTIQFFFKLCHTLQCHER